MKMIRIDLGGSPSDDSQLLSAQMRVAILVAAVQAGSGATRPHMEMEIGKIRSAAEGSPTALTVNRLSYCHS